MLGVSLRARRDTTQVMLGVSLRARLDTTLVHINKAPRKTNLTRPVYAYGSCITRGVVAKRMEPVNNCDREPKQIFHIIV